MDRRLAGLPAERRVPVRRRGLLAEVAARPRRRPTPRRLHARTSRPTRREPEALADQTELWTLPAGLVRLGRRDRHRAVGAVPRSTATTACSPSSGRRWSAGSTSPRTQRGRNDTPAARTARPDPAPHEEYLWDGGFHWGEWLEPATPRRAVLGRSTKDTSGPRSSTTAQHCSRASAGCSVTTTRPRGSKTSPPRRSHAWRTEYIAADGSLTPDTQANHVRALAFGLVPRRAARAQTAARLVELIRAAGTHLGTGFLATPYLLPVLADTGHLDVAYELLLQDTAAVVARRWSSAAPPPSGRTGRASPTTAPRRRR